MESTLTRCPQCRAACPTSGEGGAGYSFCPGCRFPLVFVAGKYQLVEELARGGFATVYKARHIGLEQHNLRAVKVIRQELFACAGMKERFFREVQVTSQLSQHNLHIIRIFDDFGEVSNLGFYYVMEFLEGRSLRELLDEARGEPLPLPLCQHLFVQLCDAMKAAHREHIVHRDLKPANLFVVETERDPTFLKVLDFGIAKPFQGRGKSTGGPRLTQGVIGTPLYMSPEQCLAQRVDERSDIYSMGLILFELLAGCHPFAQGGSPLSSSGERLLLSRRELMASHLYRRAPSLFAATAAEYDFPVGLDGVLQKALAKRPSDRFESVIHMLDAFIEVLAVPGQVPVALLGAPTGVATDPTEPPVPFGWASTFEAELLKAEKGEEARKERTFEEPKAQKANEQEVFPIHHINGSGDEFPEVDWRGPSWRSWLLGVVFLGLLVGGRLLFSVSEAPKVAAAPMVEPIVLVRRQADASPASKGQSPQKLPLAQKAQPLVHQKAPMKKRVKRGGQVPGHVPQVHPRGKTLSYKHSPKKMPALRRRRLRRRRRVLGPVRHVLGCPKKALFWTLLLMSRSLRERATPSLRGRGSLVPHPKGLCVGVFDRHTRLHLGRSSEGYVPCALVLTRLASKVKIALQREGGFEPTSNQYCVRP